MLLVETVVVVVDVCVTVMVVVWGTVWVFVTVLVFALLGAVTVCVFVDAWSRWSPLGLVTVSVVVLPAPTANPTITAIAAPARNASTTGNHGNRRRGRRSCPHLGQKSASAGTRDPQLGQITSGGSGVMRGTLPTVTAGGLRQSQRNAEMPVNAPPITSACTSAVPS